MVSDLSRSGLSPEDLFARPLESVERNSIGVPATTHGYVIPYYNIQGKPVPFYRSRLLDHDPKYMQVKDTPNHVYFPKNFLNAANKMPFLIITEGEKKAALATKLGYPTVGFGGVDSWRNRIFTIPAAVELTQNQVNGPTQAKLPSGVYIDADSQAAFANGMQDLLDYVLINNKTVVIIYDSEHNLPTGPGVDTQVQRAAASLGYELRYRGIPFSHIRQLILPTILPKSNRPTTLSKVALDDALVYGQSAFNQQLKDILNLTHGYFPQHPNVREYVNRRLQKARLDRREMQAVGIAILSDLDATGVRLKNDATDAAYYFNFRTRELTKAVFGEYGEVLHNTPFGQFLYKRYGISNVDSKILQWLGAQFTGEDPMERVSPHRVIARKDTQDDTVTYQLSDSQFAIIDADGYKVYSNGEQGIMFESGQVMPLDIPTLKAHYDQQQQQQATNGGVFPFWWGEVLQDSRILDKDKQLTVTGLLYYLSPWLFKWRGIQLPIELMLGESGSGKSTVCELRLNILEGKSQLRNAPQDLKDWHASISNAGGLHVTDNVQLVDRGLRQRLSDDICRIITEPSPFIEMRKYFTNADLMRVPIRVAFAMTAIQQPFMQADLFARAIIVDFKKPIGDDVQVRYDSQWQIDRLNKYGGREAWVAHHICVLQRFFQLVNASWDPKYLAKHRLINFEHALIKMAEVFNIPSSWIPDHLVGLAEQHMEEADWTLEGIRAFADQYRTDPNKRFTAQEVSNWCMGHEEYTNCENLTSPRRLGRYLRAHGSMVAQVTGFVEAGKMSNRERYKVIPLQRQQKQKDGNGDPKIFAG